MRVVVKNNNISKAYRVLKKKLYNEGVVKELTDRRFYVKPSDERRRKKIMAKRRQQKASKKNID